MSEIIILKQLPIIEQQLSVISTDMQIAIDTVKAMECTTESKAQVKKERAKINKQFKQIEAKRIEVKDKIMAPYLAFEAIYKEKIKDVATSGLADIDAKINEIDQGLLDQKTAEVTAYFDELITAKEIDFVSFENTGAKVNLSVTVTALKKQIAEYINGVESALTLIATQEHEAEILAEYKKSLDVNSAIVMVKERHERVAREAERLAEAKRQEEERKARADEIRQAAERDLSNIATPVISAPVMQTPAVQAPEIVEEKTYKATFTVTATKDKLIALKAYMVQEGIVYE